MPFWRAHCGGNWKKLTLNETTSASLVTKLLSVLRIKAWVDVCSKAVLSGWKMVPGTQRSLCWNCFVQQISLSVSCLCNLWVIFENLHQITQVWAERWVFCSAEKLSSEGQMCVSQGTDSTLPSEKLQGTRVWRYGQFNLIFWLTLKICFHSTLVAANHFKTHLFTFLPLWKEGGKWGREGADLNL